MLKYLYVREIFKEIPGEITLGISLTGCKIRCHGCHSPELWKDIGKPLTLEVLDNLLKTHKGITCICFFGGEHEIQDLIFYASYIRTKIKVAWYSGLDFIQDKMLGFFDYVKIGRYREELGGLENPKSNQHLYKVIKDARNLLTSTKHYKVNLVDITDKLRNTFNKK